MRAEISQMTADDYDEVVALWQDVEGVGLHLDDVDSREGVAAYLRRNPGLSFVARIEGDLVGAVLCGHDGRRGYLHHLAVAPQHRRRGIGRALVERCLGALRSMGFRKCHLMLFAGNDEARRFWQAIGWSARSDIQILSRDLVEMD